MFKPTVTGVTKPSLCANAGNDAGTQTVARGSTGN
jgi:hypothetical protein